MLALAKHGRIHQYPNTGDVEARGSGVRGKTRLYEIRGIVFFFAWMCNNPSTPETEKQGDYYRFEASLDYK